MHKLPTPMASDGMRDGAGGGSGSTHPFRQILATPRKTDADRGFRGDVLSQLNGYPSRHAGMLPTPIASSQMTGQSNPGLKAKGVIYPAMGPLIEIVAERLDAGRYRGDMEGWAKMPTPLASDHKGSLGVMSGGKVKSPNVPTYLRDGKWAYARQIAAMLTEAGLTGPSHTLPTTYGWMMGFPPGWLARAFKSAMEKRSLLPASSSRRSATPSSRKSQKPSVAPSSE
ncbi:hypothetical protein [Sphingomonas sp. 1P08PE]|uniref:hypothetical protein n=1 Tax=Sphingomonas sp. 1P08PE TaxID=554122 RepID=UPI0039A23AE0